ncbi:hypothetical protein F5051DRAFT_477054 [Lentinula edodes]|nr:hypothetical protein F5051DRAFT_477054 [Lentinula edodes]
MKNRGVFDRFLSIPFTYVKTLYTYTHLYLFKLQASGPDEAKPKKKHSTTRVHRPQRAREFTLSGDWSPGTVLSDPTRRQRVNLNLKLLGFTIASMISNTLSLPFFLREPLAEIELYFFLFPESPSQVKRLRKAIKIKFNANDADHFIGRVLCLKICSSSQNIQSSNKSMNVFCLDYICYGLEDKDKDELETEATWVNVHGFGVGWYTDTFQEFSPDPTTVKGMRPAHFRTIAPLHKTND